MLDPRNKELGARIIINLEKLYLSLKKLNLTSSNVEEYYELSHQLGIAQIDTEKLKNQLFGIECNCEELNGIDFQKGCYVGQENTARIKLKNKLIKRLFPIKVISGTLEKGTIDYKEIEVGKIVIKGRFPFALIKFKKINLDEDIEYKCGEARLKIIRPEWIK